MMLVHLPVAAIVVERRQRPVDEGKARDIARSIEHQGLLQPIGVQASDDAETYRLVYGAHRLAAMHVLGRTEIDAYLLPEEWSDEECLLAELQENSARNDLTGAQRKAYAAEIGRLLSQFQEHSHFPNGKNNWLDDMGKTSNTPQTTMYTWWKAFCAESGLTITPSKALDADKHRFFTWLDDQQRAAEADNARKAATALALKRAQDLEEARMYLRDLIAEHDEDTVWEESIVPVFPLRCAGKDTPPCPLT